MFKFKIDEEEKTGLLGGLVLLMFGIIISLLLAYAHKKNIEQNASKPAKTVCIQVDQNGNITEVKKNDITSNNSNNNADCRPIP